MHVVAGGVGQERRHTRLRAARVRHTADAHAQLALAHQQQLVVHPMHRAERHFAHRQLAVGRATLDLVFGAARAFDVVRSDALCGLRLPVGVERIDGATQRLHTGTTTR